MNFSSEILTTRLLLYRASVRKMSKMKLSIFEKTFSNFTLFRTEVVGLPGEFIEKNCRKHKFSKNDSSGVRTHALSDQRLKLAP